MTIMEGTLSVSGRQYENLVGVPFRAEGPSVLQLVGDERESARLAGSGVSIELTGDATFIEDLPWDLEE